MGIVDKFGIQAKAYWFFWNGVDWLFPPECIGCGKEGAIICPECLHGMMRAELNSCIYCGVKLPKRGVCTRCGHIPHAIHELRYVAAYQGVMRTAIQRLKYERDLGVGLELAKMLAQIVQVTDWQIDLIMPVPLSEKRQAQRGYNQAALLAYPLSLQLHLPENTKGLVRVHETRSQVNLNFQERQENVQGAFCADPSIVKDKTILLVDDVFTTGATINAAAAALRESGSKRVYALTAAKALGRQVTIENAPAFDV
ncbi:MAG: Putative phosphoribosyltransferase [Anaerolineae bacterium 49_20]|nr:MAG: Putative phosphoribosyltransferase [Anaerolineae bacterium 49_20]